ncbi:MAG: hypothetical protein AAF560_08225 [Acidobacteriota bacterium]
MNEPATSPPPLPAAVEPLARRTGSGERLRRPIAIEREIATALELPASQLRAMAAGGTDGDRLSSECVVHLIRQDLRRGSRHLADELTPLLLARCDASLRGSVRGFDTATAREVREEVLGRVALSLLEPGDEADFLEVRFALALKRLRIDACRKARRRLQRQVELEATGDEDAPSPVERLPPQPARQEDRLVIRQALAKLGDAEREVLVLHRLAGLPLRSQDASKPDLVTLLGRSERTLRNRLRAAERQLAAFREPAR